MEIKRIGSYLETDKDGFLVNPASVGKFQDEWIPVIEEVKQEYIKHFTGEVVSIYIRGSVAKGEAINYISDVDSFAVVSRKHEDIDTSWSKAFNQRIKEKYPFVVGVEIAAVPIEELPEHKADQIMIKTQSACIYGKDLANDINPFKPGKGTAQHIRGIEREVKRTLEWLQEDHTSEEIKSKCTWIMKRLLRSGFELVMERSQKYTRDLYPCYEGFAIYYPQKADEMYEVLELAINPTEDKGIIQRILNGIGTWVAEEVEDIN